jgi:hypothetical protein
MPLDAGEVPHPSIVASMSVNLPSMSGWLAAADSTIAKGAWGSSPARNRTPPAKGFVQICATELDGIFLAVSHTVNNDFAVITGADMLG